MAEIVSSPGVVNENEKRNLHHSKFPLKQTKFTTEQFGLVKPHFYIDGVSDDRLPIRSDIDTTSYTLKAPLMQDVYRRLSYVKVDYPAILPYNFDKIFTNPVVGGDVPVDANTVLENGYSLLYETFSTQLVSALNYSFTRLISQGTNITTNTTAFQSLISLLVIMECFYSRGSLLSSLGCHLSRQIAFGNLSLANSKFSGHSFDEFFDDVMSLISEAIYDKGSVRVEFSSREDPDSGEPGSNMSHKILYVGGPDSDIDFATFLALIRDHANWALRFPDIPGSLEFNSDKLSAFKSKYYSAPDEGSTDWEFQISYRGPVNAPFNFAKVCAYQLAVAEFMTDDHVDDIYNAELFRQYIGSLIANRNGSEGYYGFSASREGFPLNGVQYDYDFLSGHYLKIMLESLTGSYSFGQVQYFLSLFGYRRSLRYKDYFVSSRCRPLAVGDVSVNVQDSSVNVIDITRNIQVQRFLNRVNHIGRDLRDYVRGIFGVEISPDRHVPHYLADITELVYTSKVENTGEAQQTQPNSVTATFTGNSRTKQLDVFVDVPCIILGLTSYDIERLYIDGIDRQYFAKDRYDMFVPELQFVGDQSLYIHELDAGNSSEFGTPFGYQYRDMQYKLLVPQADGGFIDYLPGYAFMFKNQLYNGTHIGSNFIRSVPTEMDEFYLSLTGFSLASRFHFISRIDNFIDSSRPMIANPNILE